MENIQLQIKNWTKSESFIVNMGLILLILILFLWLYLEFQFSIGKAGEPIGSITYQVNDTQRKFSSNFLWSKLELNSKVYNYDTVRTDSSSKISVLLLDKTEIQLEENSMVVFDLSKDNLDLEFLKGKVRLDSMNGDPSKKIKIVSGDSVVNMENGMVQLDKLASSSVNVNVLEGKAEIKKNDKVENLEKGDEAKIRGENLQKERKKIRLLSPINSRYFLTRKSYDVEFEWVGENSPESYSFELFNSNEKGKPIIAVTVQGNNYSQNLPPGKYFWKVSDLKKNNVETDSFYIADENPVTLYTPKPESFYEYSTNPPRILFSWSRNEFIRYYKLEISDSKTFDKIKFQLTTENETTIIDNLESGKYYYRLITKTEFPDSVNKVSIVNSFTINKKETPKEKLNSKERTLLDTKEDLPKFNLVSPKDQIELDTDKIQFAWEKFGDNTEYTLEFSKSSDFKDISLTRKSNANSLNVTLLENGRFFWRVKAVNTTGITTSNSFNFSYQYNPIPTIAFPANNSEIDVLKMEKFPFRWQKMENAIYYSFELKRLSNNSSVVRESRLKANEYILEDFTLLKSGEYECIVSARILTKNSDEITSQPKINKFKIFLSKKAEQKDIKFITPENVYIEH